MVTSSAWPGRAPPSTGTRGRPWYRCASRSARACPYIAGDELTHDGCPLAWPVSRREYHLLPRLLQITTGRFAEHWIVSTLLLAGLGYLLWRNTGIAGLVNHLHDSGTAAP